MAQSDNKVSLFLAQTTAGNSSTVTWYCSGEWEFSAWGTWDGATIKLQHSPDGGTRWIDSADTNASAVSFTNDGAAEIRIPYGQLIRANLASAGAATNLNVALFRYS